MSEQQAEQTSAESGSVDAGPAVPPSSETQSQPVAAAPDLVPGQGADAGADGDLGKSAPRVMYGPGSLRRGGRSNCQ